MDIPSGEATRLSNFQFCNLFFQQGQPLKDKISSHRANCFLIVRADPTEGFADREANRKSQKLFPFGKKNQKTKHDVIYSTAKETQKFATLKLNKNKIG